MQNPRARVIGGKPNGNVVIICPDAGDVALDRVDVVVDVAAGATDDIKDVAVKVQRVLHANRNDEACDRPERK